MDRRSITKDVFDAVISSIPNTIINLLPDSPLNLLPYATRVKEINVGKHIDDRVKGLMYEHLLSDEEYLKTFYYVMAITFVGKTPVEHPTISVVAAQTGSGKSNLTAKLLRQDDNYIFVDSDKYKHFRYDAQEIAKNYQVEYPALTGPDGYDHAENIYRYAVEHKYNIIKESAPSANKGILGIDKELVLANGYRINLNILAVGELNSLLSTHERYELQIIHGLKTCKLTPTSRHDESYNSLIKNVEEVLNDKDIERISVFVRGTLENEFHPVQIYPSDDYNSPIEAIKAARIIDNDKTKKEFQDRYDLVISQMNLRNAPQAQYDQIENIKKRAEEYNG